jgi:hypothetical protein
VSDVTEEPLYGGLISGRCVRVGDTVRRPWLPSSAAVQHLLSHLERRGFAGAPRPLGSDEQGREMVSWVDGEPTFGAARSPLLQPGAVHALGAFARRLHEALGGYTAPTDAHWQTDCGGNTFVHGDLGVWNVVWLGDEPIAAVDWELAGPGEHLADLAMLAKSAVPLVPDERVLPTWKEIPPRRERLEELCHGYGIASDLLLTWMLAGPRSATVIATHGRAGEEPWATYYKHGLHERETADHEWLRAWCRAQ